MRKATSYFFLLGLLSSAHLAAYELLHPSQGAVSNGVPSGRHHCLPARGDEQIPINSTETSPGTDIVNGLLSGADFASSAQTV
jgi:hypothetical protein